MAGRFYKKFGRTLLIIVFIFISVSSAPAQPVNPDNYTGTIRVACVGDSITFGAGIEDRQKNSYPAQLQALLGDKYEVRNFGHSGARVCEGTRKPYMSLPEYKAALSFKPHVVIICLGINDASVSEWSKNKIRFVQDYTTLIESFRDVSITSDPKIWLGSLLPVVPPYEPYVAIQKTKAQADALIDQIAKELDLPVIDLFTRLNMELQFFPDGLHPDKNGAAIIAKTVCQSITGDCGGLQMPWVFGDHMVLQRQKPISVFGTADVDSTVTVNLGANTQKTTADHNGRWRVDMPAMQPGRPQTLICSDGKKTLTFSDVLIGDVWYASGQSNMDWQMRQDADWATEGPTADQYPQIRLLNRQGNPSGGAGTWSPQQTANVTVDSYYSGQWQVGSQQSAAPISAVAYYFARDIHRATGVPIGIIDDAKGGAPMEAFMPRHALSTPELYTLTKDWIHAEDANNWHRGRAKQNLGRWFTSPKKTPMPHHPFEPCFLYHADTVDLIPFAIRGVIWYQGESNATDSSNQIAWNQERNRQLFEGLITSWRDAWGQGEFPFYYVQLPNLNRNWMLFREMQLQTLDSLPNLGMAVTIDLGHPTNVHPKAKRQVARRLSLWARANSYGEKIVYSGPLYNGSFEKKGNRLHIGFDHTAKGLETTDGGQVTGFEIADEFGNWQPATVELKGDTAAVFNDDIKSPQAVRYGWAPNPKVNLCNSEKLPASPFRAGDFQFKQKPVKPTASTAFRYAYEATNTVLPAKQAGQTWTHSFGKGEFEFKDNALYFKTPVAGGQDFRQDKTGSDWSRQIGPDKSWTVEFSVRIVDGQGANPGMIVWMGQGTAQYAGYIVIGPKMTRWGNASSPNQRVLDRSDNSDRQHVYRVAFDGLSKRYTVWRDGVQIGSELSAGIKGLSQKWLIVVDSGSKGSAEGYLKYIRWDTSGAFPPIANKGVATPYIVGVPPVDAGRGLIRASDTEIRHYGGRGAKIYLVSYDNGQTWQELPLPNNYPDLIGLTKEGPSFARIPGTDEFLRVSHSSKGKLYRTEGGLDGKWIVVADKDGNETPFKGILHHPYFVKDGKRWIIPAHGGGMWVYYSDDEGQTWQTSNRVETPPHRPGGIHKGTRWNHNAAEPCIVPLNDGRLWRLIRCAQDNHYESFSSDDGQTWTEPAPSRFYGTITMPNVARLRDGRLLMVWNNTTPLPELERATGRGEDVFTNRDISHAAISEDDGKTWIGFREVILDEHRNDSDYAVTAGSNDRGKQQNEFLELEDGVVLLAVGQHPLHRKLMIVDVDWLYETSRSDDFSQGLKDWSVHQFIAGIRGHCGYNRKQGAKLVPHTNESDKSVLNICRPDDPELVCENQGAVWNFPTMQAGVFTTRIQLQKGFKGGRISLIDRWFNPTDLTAHLFAMFNLEIPADGKISDQTVLKAGQWFELKFEWDGLKNEDADTCTLYINNVPQTQKLKLNRPSINGISYVHFISTAQDTDKAGFLIESVAANMKSPAQQSKSEVKRNYPDYKQDELLLFRSGLVDVEMQGEKTVVTEHSDRYGVKQYRIPHITRLPDGRLLVAIVCRLSTSGDGGRSTTFFAVSDDNGKKWDYIRHNTDYKNIDQRPSGAFPLTERTQETQVVYYPAMDKYVAVYLTQRAVWTTTSDDLKNWTPPAKAELNVEEIAECWPSPASLTVDSDGSLLFAITGSEMVNGKKQRFTRLVWTRDLKHYEVSPSMPVKGNETAVAQLDKDRYFVTTRIGPERLNMYYHRGDKSWSEPTPFPEKHHWRCEVDVINDNGTLYLSTPTEGRTKGTIYKSTDQGKSWQTFLQVTDDYFAYSSLVKMSNGNIGLVAERAYSRGKTQRVLTDIVFREISL